MASTPPPLSRRAFLPSTIAAALAACGSNEVAAPAPTVSPTATPDPTAAPTPAPPTPTPTATPAPDPTATPTPVDLAVDPFTLGVASGDPTPDAVILWTRLAIEPLTGGAMPDERFDVGWEVATDATFANVVASGSAAAVPDLAHSVHVDATGLDPDTWYSYRFVLGQYVSTAGRTRTVPAPDSSPARLRIGVSSCQHWETGHYAAHDHLADEDLDLFIFLGDYIYENGPRDDLFESPTGTQRRHTSGEILDLDAYRNRYGLYRTDAQLQRHHASRPWFITWDDHEVENNYAGALPNNATSSREFLVRRAEAYQAWYEHMPVRLDAPDGPDYQIHRDLVWGDLAHIFLLDGRQYRDKQPTDGAQLDVPGLDGLPFRTLGPTALDPDHRMLGLDQQRWMTNDVSTSTRTWKVLGQQVFMHGLTLIPGSAMTLTDSWDGYFANRQEILQGFVDAGVEDLVVLTGDFHSFTVGDVRPDPYDLEGPVVASEFMAGPISSTFPTRRDGVAPLVKAFNPQIKLFEPRNGYGVCEFTPNGCTMQYRVLDDVQDPRPA